MEMAVLKIVRKFTMDNWVNGSCALKHIHGSSVGKLVTTLFILARYT